MHLEEIYQSRQLSHLVKEFEIKYFNERSKVTLNPVKKTGPLLDRPGTDEDDIKKLLNMLGDNEELNKKEWTTLFWIYFYLFILFDLLIYLFFLLAYFFSIKIFSRLSIEVNYTL